jgi:hypothetical protein
VFARAPAYQLKHSSDRGAILLTADECQEFLRDGKPFRFDLYRIHFNDGQGSEPEPLAGASMDGFSNYFPKYRQMANGSCSARQKTTCSCSQTANSTSSQRQADRRGGSDATPPG